MLSFHTKSSVRVSRHGAWKGIEIRWPSTATLELVLGFVQWCIAASASVYTLVWVMLVVLEIGRAHV